MPKVCKRAGHLISEMGRASNGYCVACRKERNAWLRDSGAGRNNMLKKYGISQEIYDSIAALQCGRCAICDLTPEPIGGKKVGLFVDHDHETGLVRGLVCNGCNVGLGNFKDSAQRLRLAAQYLDDNYSEGLWPPPEDT